MGVHVVIGYRRSTQHLITHEVIEGSEMEKALHHRNVLQRDFEHDPDVEVIIISGDSLDAIQHSHGRYFMSTSQLLRRLRGAGSGPRRRHGRVGGNSVAAAI